MTLTDTNLTPPRRGVTLSDMKLPDPASPGSTTRGVGRLEPGTEVEVRSKFDQRWTSGFEVIRVGEQGYRLLRLSDGEALPGFFPPDDVRRSRRRGGTWWY